MMTTERQSKETTAPPGTVWVANKTGTDDGGPGLGRVGRRDPTRPQVSRSR
ncbi:hypothetical protein [Nonomuraea jiangxiensis]|uniref:Uncharacterized protein n=1 Tax=Nonomuraea jiangxiensis TaxID=633440 RepID=A0A1G9QNE9_9ACTN|nr:hypothetical protein [Nonomuraea jiangxiensis]SDM12097.1 hypothetical protein SAMN05421869_13685 [Nonomuraea jiangxiensis]